MEILRRIIELEDHKGQLEEDLKHIGSELRELKRQLNLDLALEGVEKLTAFGRVVTPVIDYHCSVNKDDEPEFHTRLKDAGLGDVITEGVHHKRLPKMYKTMKDVTAMSPIIKLINVFEQPTVSMRNTRG